MEKIAIISRIGTALVICLCAFCCACGGTSLQKEDVAAVLLASTENSESAGNDIDTITNIILEAYRTGDFRTLYKDYYSEYLLEVSGVDIEEELSLNHMAWKSHVVRDITPVDLIKNSDDTWKYIVGFTYSDDENTASYQEVTWEIFSENGLYVCATKSQFGHWHDVSRKAGIQVEYNSKAYERDTTTDELTDDNIPPKGITLAPRQD